MTTTLVRKTDHDKPLSAMAKEDGKAFFVIFASAFVVLLATALVAQTLGLQWRSWLPGAEGVKSVTGGVKASVYTFMSHLQ
jgi:light-harvesting complex 1 beta chain